MGNTSTSQKADQPRFLQTGSDKLVVQLRSRSIIIHYGYKFSLNIGDVAMFPHGLSGLKLWQSNIVLARFVVMNNSLFKGKKVLELGAGTGIGGITVSKWTKCQSIAMSDSREEVVRNLTKNCERNAVKDIVIFRLNLTEYQLFTNKYDIILCSEILRPSPISLQQIYLLLKHFLQPNGCAYIVMSDNVEKIEQFSDVVDSAQFQFKYQKLVEEEYYASPLLNKVEGYKEFQMLEQQDYYVVKMKRKDVKKDEEKSPLIKKLPQLPKSININQESQEQQKNLSPIDKFKAEQQLQNQEATTVPQPIEHSKPQSVTVPLQQPLEKQQIAQKQLQQKINETHHVEANIEITEPTQLQDQEDNFHPYQSDNLNDQQPQHPQQRDIAQQQTLNKQEPQTPILQTPIIQHQQIQNQTTQQSTQNEAIKEQSNQVEQSNIEQQQVQNERLQVEEKQQPHTSQKQKQSQIQQQDVDVPAIAIEPSHQSQTVEQFQVQSEDVPNNQNQQNPQPQEQIVQQQPSIVETQLSHENNPQPQEDNIVEELQTPSLASPSEENQLQSLSLSKSTNIQQLTHIKTLQSKENSDQIIEVTQQNDFIQANEQNELSNQQEKPQPIDQIILSSEENSLSLQKQNENEKIQTQIQETTQQQSTQQEPEQNQLHAENNQYQQQDLKQQESTQHNNQPSHENDHQGQNQSQNTQETKTTQTKAKNKKNKKKR